MSRTITVKGVGSVSAKPDYVMLSLHISAVDMQYDAAAKLASNQLDALNEAVEAVGFEKGSIKTTDFNVSTEYESYPDKKGNYQSRFAGYRFSQQLKLTFHLDSERLSQTLSAISSCSVQPELNISFTVKDPGTVRAELLRSAAANAREKAEILCEASGCALGELMSIDYSWREHVFISPTRYGMNSRCEPKAMLDTFSAAIEPDNINVTDTASFVWELA